MAKRHAAEEGTQGEVMPWTTPVQRDHHAPGDKQANADGLNHAMSLARDVNLYTGRGAEPWPTPRNCTAMGAEFTDAAIANAGDRFPNLESVVQQLTSQPTGGSLWPVTDSEPGRVARLKAVGNSVSPAWCHAGPFQFILDREGLRDGNPDID